MSKIKTNILKRLFPHLDSYLLFVCMICFLYVLIDTTDKYMVLPSMIGTIYCYHEWLKDIRGA